MPLYSFCLDASGASNGGSVVAVAMCMCGCVCVCVGVGGVEVGATTVPINGPFRLGHRSVRTQGVPIDHCHIT